MTTLRTRVRQLMNERGWKDKDLAAAAGKTPPWASTFFSGKRGLPLGTIEEVARALNVHPADLLQEPREPVASLEGFATVPLLKSRIAAGSPLALDVDPDDQKISFSARLVRKYPGCICLRVGPKEESMLPTISPGDTVLVDRSPEVRLRPRSGTVYAVNYARLNGDPGSAVKRVEVTDGVLVVSSDNPDKHHYPTLVRPLDGLNLLEVLVGQVVWHGRYLTPRKA